MNIPKIILASKSPRRQELLRLMDLEFEVVLKDVDESYPDGLTPQEVAVYIARKKAEAFDETIGNEVVLTADTIVCVDGQILGKPETPQHAVEMLQMLSGKVHLVVTGVCLLYKHQYNNFFDVSEVFFRKLSLEEINSYVAQYTNVVGLPTEKLYAQLINLNK
jgi:septum formation protein